MAVVKSFCNRGKGFQPIIPLPLSVFLKGKFSHHAGEHCRVGFQIVFIILHILCQLVHGGFPVPQLPGHRLNLPHTVPVELSAVLRPRVSQQLDPVYMNLLFAGSHIQIIGSRQRLTGGVKFHPLDIVARGGHLYGLPVFCCQAAVRRLVSLFLPDRSAPQLPAGRRTHKRQQQDQFQPDDPPACTFLTALMLSHICSRISLSLFPLRL